MVVRFVVVWLERWSSVPVNCVAVVGCVCGCGWWSGVVIGVVGIVGGGVVRDCGVVVVGGGVAVGSIVVVGVRCGGGGVVCMVVDVVASGGLACGGGCGVVVGISIASRDFLLP